jgi:hypothetical protein
MNRVGAHCAGADTHTLPTQVLTRIRLASLMCLVVWCLHLVLSTLLLGEQKCKFSVSRRVAFNSSAEVLGLKTLRLGYLRKSNSVSPNFL